MTRYTPIVFTLVCATAAGGCYGQFTLTRKLHAWNGHATDNKVANSAIMWGLLIVPVYEVAALVDLLIFNVIEFYGDENPLAMDAEGNATLTRDGHVYTFSQLPSGEVAVSVDGRPAIRYQKKDGVFEVRDVASNAVHEVPAAAAYAAARPRMRSF